MKIGRYDYLVLGALGLLALAFTSAQPVEKTSLENISASNLGEKVRISGTVKSSSSFSRTTFLNVSDGTGEIPVVSFSSGSGFPSGENVSVTGRLTMYEGKLEIVADKISRAQ